MKRALVIAFILLVSFGIISAETLEKGYLCEKTYYGIKNNLTENQIINQIEVEKKLGTPREIIDKYVDNWENICSEQIKRVIDEKELCKDIYFFVLNNGWKFSSYKISKELDLSYEIIGNYLDNFNNFCEEKLPNKKLNKIIIYPETECSLENKFFNSSMTFFTIAIDKKCDDVGILNYILRFEDNGYGMQITGIRIYFIFSLIFLFLTLTIVSISRKNNKLQNNYF